MSCSARVKHGIVRTGGVGSPFPSWDKMLVKVKGEVE